MKKNSKKHKNTCCSRNYINGYNDGYKDGRGHKTKLHKYPIIKNPQCDYHSYINGYIVGYDSARNGMRFVELK